MMVSQRQDPVFAGGMMVSQRQDPVFTGRIREK